MFNAPEGDLLMTGKTLKSLERNVLIPMQSYIPITYSLHTKQAQMLNKRVHLEGANDKQSESKIRGMTIAGHYGDEVTLWPETYFVQSLARMSVAGSRFLGTTNPDSPYHWLKTDWIDADKGMVTQKLTIDDNIHLAPVFVNALKREYTGLFYKRYILGQWVVAEGAVYDMFDDKIHVVSELPRMKRYFVGVDYGTNNPTVFILIGQSMDNKFYICREYYHDGGNSRQKTDAEYVKDLKGFLPKQYENVVIDPSAKSFIVACQRAGIKHIRQADNAVLDGIRSVGSLLHNNLLFCHKSCTNTIREFQSYSWDIKAQEKGEDKPMKENDHALDGTRYAFHTNYRFWKGILDHKAQTIDRLEGARL